MVYQWRMLGVSLIVSATLVEVDAGVNYYGFLRIISLITHTFIRRFFCTY